MNSGTNEKLPIKQSIKDEINNKIFDNLNEMNEYIINIKSSLDNLKNNILSYINLSEDSIKAFQKEINNFIFSLEGDIIYKNKIDLQKMFNNVENTFEPFYSNNFNIYESNYIKNIKIFNEKIKEKYEIIKDDIDFDPPKANTFDSFQIKFNPNINNSISYYENERIQNYLNNKEGLYNNSIYFNQKDDISETDNEEINNVQIKCSVCNKNEANTFCENCSKLFCDNCFNKKDNIEDMHHISRIDIYKTYKKKGKILFLNSLNQIIKSIITSCSYLLSHEIIEADVSLNVGLNNNDDQLMLKY